MAKAVSGIKYVVLTCDPPYSKTAPGYVRDGGWDTDTDFTPDIWFARIFHDRKSVDSAMTTLKYRTNKTLMVHAAVFRLANGSDMEELAR